MPDTTYKTFLSPGSCQLEVTDLVASANDDKGVDLYGVAWEIEQVLIAGEGFAASPTDVWVNERGILNVGQSLFDKINQTANDNDNVPGQCTIVVKATSLVDSSKVARLKVLVGYPGEGGGGGGGGGDFSTASVTITNDSNKSFMLTVPFINRGGIVSVLNSTDMDGTAIEAAIYGTGSLCLVIGDNLPTTIACTGDVSNLGNGAILIKGDGTITFNDQQD